MTQHETGVQESEDGWVFLFGLRGKTFSMTERSE